MSIADEINARVAEGRLIRQVPLLKGRYSRVVYVEAKLHREIAGGYSSDDPIAFRVGQLTRDFDRFSSGALITVGYGQELSCFFKQLDQRSEEVWEIRSRDPKPSCRVFGRFAMPDVFVALNASLREPLAGERSLEWKEQIRNCKAGWRRLFQTYDPHSGTQIHDYIRDNVVEVGKLP